MYSGTTIRIKSGRVMGAHQKIDRVARRELAELLPSKRYFPAIKDILHFEGMNGPDGIKRKSPSVDEPWHYVDPTNPADIGIYQLINDHIDNLAIALRSHNEQRAAFEAAWLAHAVVDALTPAHHYPLSDKIEELWGKPKEERRTIREKNIIKGDNRRDTMSKNWQYWGAKGVFTTHFMFEFGVASTISPLRFAGVTPDSNMLVRAKKNGFESVLRDSLMHVFSLDMYTQFHKSGWNRRLARQTRHELAPTIIKMVILAWFIADDCAASSKGIS